MSDSPRASVIILNYNGRTFTEGCVDSVLAQSDQDFEIILLDNGSEENDFDFLQKRFGQNPKINLQRSETNLFFAGGNNLAASFAKGRFLVFLNNDTLVDPSWLKELMNFVQDDESCLVQPKILLESQRGTIDNVGGNYLFPGFGLGRGAGEKDLGQYDHSINTDYANGTCFLISRSLFEKLAGFDEWYQLHYEDVDLNLRAKRLGAQAKFCARAVIFHRGSLTIKKTTPARLLSFHIHKNRLLTVAKNFSGLDRFSRLLCLLPISLIIYPNAVKAFLERLWRLEIEKTRLRELSLLTKVGSSWLDVGSGEGVLATLALQKGFKATAIDSSPRGFYLKARRASLQDFTSDQKFDAVLLLHVLEHLADPASGLKRAVSFLKKDGILVIEVPLVGNLTEKFLGPDYFIYQDKTHCHFFTKTEIVKLVKDQGLEIKKEGSTILQFPIYLVRASFRKNFFKGILSLFLYPSFKILSLAGKNTEIIRLYSSRYIGRPARYSGRHTPPAA